jgi:hypothetical protein
MTANPSHNYHSSPSVETGPASVAAGGRSVSRGEFMRGAAGVGLGVAIGSTSALELLGIAPGVGTATAAAGLPQVHRFHSRPDLVPPTVSVVGRTGSLAAGSLFLAPSSGPGQRGALIVDDAGEPLWFRPSTPVTAMNLRVALYRGAPLLTWWEGKFEHLVGEGAHVLGFLAEGTHVIADEHYRVIARPHAGNGLPSDMYEFLLTPEGTALLTSWEIVEMDLRSVGGPAKGSVVGGVVQELELPSGNVLFEWHSVEHVALEESYGRVGHPFDYFHINSIAPNADGNLLVSARNTWTVYSIDRGSGEVIWRLGGKKSSFAMGPNTLFAWQHDARPHADELVSVFDDGAAPRVQPQSRGLMLSLDITKMRATFHRSYPHVPRLLAHALGSTQLLENGNVLVGYGTAPHFTEFTGNGDVLLDARLPPGGENYRALRFPWKGLPADRPRIVALVSTGASRLYVSWNGATEVAAWQLQTGQSAERLSAALTVPRRGFETVLPIPSATRYAAALALDQSGALLGTSDTIRI